MLEFYYMDLIEVCVVYYGKDVDVMCDYLIFGYKCVVVLDNWGLIEFDENGDLVCYIVDVYCKYGFYVFMNVF